MYKFPRSRPHPVSGSAEHTTEDLAVDFMLHSDRFLPEVGCHDIRPTVHAGEWKKEAKLGG
jgi:hypothetical protein